MIASVPLILASTSGVRRRLLTEAKVPFEARPSNVDEDRLKAANAGASPDQLAHLLARAKAAAVSRLHPSAAVLGCDQVLVLGDKIFDKPADRAEAHAHLRAFSNRTHRLISAATIFMDGAEIWHVIDTASLTVRELSEGYIERYLDAEGDAVLTSVGAYRIEGLGIQLFSKIDGDHFTVMGLPLLPLLAQLRALGIIDT